MSLLVKNKKKKLYVADVIGIDGKGVRIFYTSVESSAMKFKDQKHAKGFIEANKLEEYEIVESRP